MNNENNNPVKLGITSRIEQDRETTPNTPENVMPNINRPVRIVYYPRLARRIDDICKRADRACKGVNDG